MSQNHHDTEHESPIKTPKQLITVIVLAFLVPIVLIVLLSQYITNIRNVDLNSAAMSPNAVATRLKPVADLALRRSRQRRRRRAQERRGRLYIGMQRLPWYRRGGRAQVRRPGGLGAAYQARRKSAAAIGAQRQERDARRAAAPRT